MTRLRLRLLRFGRLALGLLLGLALLPSLSQVLAPRAPAGPWAELCSSLGAPRLVRIDGAASDSVPSPSVQAEHCPLCASPLAGPPPAPLQAVPAGTGGREHPPRFAQAACTLFAWLAAQPRGPPPQA